MPSSPKKYIFHKEWAWQANNNATPPIFRIKDAYNQGFQMRYCLFFYHSWFSLNSMKTKISILGVSQQWSATVYAHDRSHSYQKSENLLYKSTPRNFSMILQDWQVLQCRLEQQNQSSYFSNGSMSKIAMANPILVFLLYG